MAGLFEPIINYYMIYGPILILISIILTITYVFISNFAAIRSAYLCTSLKNVVTGNLNKCFSSRQGPTCKKSEIGFTHGWCNDNDNYGPLRGTRTGPYSVKCNDWIWQSEDCPPDECSTKPNDWGWCADKDVQRAMRGQACGPYSGKCENWIWDSKYCPVECGKKTCTDDSCICTMVKARYVIIKRINKIETPITILDLKVYDSNGFVIKQVPRVTPWPIATNPSLLNTGANTDAYLQFDFKEDIEIGRIIISNNLNNNNLVGTAVLLRKDNNETALYRTISDVSDKYDIPVGNAENVKFSTPDEKVQSKSIISNIANKLNLNLNLTPVITASKPVAAIIPLSKIVPAITPLSKMPGSFIIKGDNMCIDSSKKIVLDECNNAPVQTFTYDELSHHLVNNKGLCLYNRKNRLFKGKCNDKETQKIFYDFVNKQFKTTTGKCLNNKLKFSDCIKGEHEFNVIPIVSMFKAPLSAVLTKPLTKREKKIKAHEELVKKRADVKEKKILAHEELVKKRADVKEQKIKAHEELVKKITAAKSTALKVKEEKRDKKIQEHKAYLKQRVELKTQALKVKEEKKEKHDETVEAKAILKLKLNRINANPGGSWSWALSADDSIYKCKNPCKGSWKRADGKFVQFDVNDKEIWAINNKNEIFKRQINGLGRWKKVPGNMKSLTLGKTEIYGTDVNNDLYSCKQPCAGKWEVSKS